MEDGLAASGELTEDDDTSGREPLIASGSKKRR